MLAELATPSNVSDRSFRDVSGLVAAGDKIPAISERKCFGKEISFILAWAGINTLKLSAEFTTS